MTTRTETISGGASFFIEGGGRFFQCHFATEPLEFRVQVSGNHLDWAPLDRGIGWAQEFDQIEIRNPTGTSQTVTVVHHTLQGYFDNRELAAQVALNGVDVQVVNSPSVNEGGSVIPFSTSSYNAVLDATGGELHEDIVAPAANVNGIRLYSYGITVITASAGKYARLASGGPQHMYAAVCDGHDWCRIPFDIGAGVGLEYKINQGIKALIVVQYELM